ncbi:unnamed protein product [Sphagnum balticum]
MRVCLKEPQRELLINGEENREKPQMARKRRRCCWRGEEQRNGNRSFQATRERERETFTDHAPRSSPRPQRVREAPAQGTI